MEPDRQFAQLLDQLREAHESLRLDNARKVAALEKEVAQLRESPASPASPVSPASPESPTSPASPATQEGDAGRADEPEEQDDGAVALNIEEKVGATNTAGGNAAPSGSPTSEDVAAAALKQQASHAHHHNLALKQETESRSQQRWHRFDAFIGLAIVLYTAVMWIGLYVDGVRNGKILVNETPPELSGTSAFVAASNHCFNALFLVEFVIRVYCFRWRYVYDERIQWFNLFDGSLVWITILEAYVLSALTMNVSYLRSLRIIRLLRSLRVVRTFRFFTSLRILVQTVAASFMALFWSMVLLAIVMLIGALSLCQLLGGSITDEGLGLGTRTWVNRYYGTPGRSLWTMFEIVFSGCWPNYARVLIEEVSSLYVIFFGFYIAGVVFAMTRIITALFLKDTLAIANTDMDMQIAAKMKEKQAYAKKLQDFFEEADVSGDGVITEAEFVAMLQEPRAAAYLAYLEIDPTESIHLFQVIDDGDGCISSEEFVRSALRLKGFARAQDLVILMHELYKVKRDVKTALREARVTHETVKEIHGREADRLRDDLLF